jgi:hypothetical protein
MTEYQASSSLAFHAIFHESRACDLEPISVTTETRAGLRVHVVFSNIAETLKVIESVTTLAAGLPATIALLVPIIVPYPLPLNEPPVSLEFLCRRISELVERVGSEVDFDAYVYLCRDPTETILAVLGPHSLVMIGTTRRPRLWFFNKSERMARELRNRGHEVILTYCS